MAFDSTAPAASSLAVSSSPFVSTDQLTQTGGLWSWRGVQPGGMLMGTGGVEREVGGCCCVIGHTFCHPSGTFQLYVATNTTVVG